MKRAFFITFFIAIAVTILLVFRGCNSCSQKPEQGGKPITPTPTPTQKDLNITILLDLSNRIDTNKNPEQWRYDIENIKVITEFFKSKIKNNPHFYKGKIRTHLLPLPSNNLKMNSIVSGLEFNCPGNAVGNKEIYDSIAKRYEQSLREIYTQTIDAGNWQRGSDIWGFFQDEVHRCIEKDTIYRNILVIFTNGYLYANGRVDAKWNNTTSIQPAYLARYRNPNWRALIDKDDVSIRSIRNDLQNLEILVLEIKSENEFVDEENILIHLWEEWFKKMGVKEGNFKVFKSTLPSMRKADIENFLN